MDAKIRGSKSNVAGIEIDMQVVDKTRESQSVI